MNVKQLCIVQASEMLAAPKGQQYYLLLLLLLLFTIYYLQHHKKLFSTPYSIVLYLCCTEGEEH